MRTRQKPRKALTLPGRVHIARGGVAGVQLADLSEGGCRFALAGPLPAKGAFVQVFVGQAGPFPALVKWAAAGEVGVTFASPLAQDQLHAFQNTHVPDAGSAAIPDELQGDTLGQLPGSSLLTPRRFC